MILLFLACSDPGPWTREAVVKPALTRVDMDGDGRITTPEWGRVGWDGGPLEKVDTDKSGGLDVAEVTAILTSVDPTRRTAAAGKPGGKGGSKTGSKEGSHGEAWLLLHLLREDILAKDPTAPVPTDDAIREADAGGVEGPAARALFAELRATATARELDFPVGLGE